MSFTAKSVYIGEQFERASFKIIELLFIAWGFKIEELKRQKSGSQYGFDIHLKVYDEHSLPIHIFIECKGSGKFNEIHKRDLSIKSEQLKLNCFPVKDAHIFFSPTRSIKYANDEVSIEDEDCPFCVIDFMKNQNGNNEYIDLFLTYEGNDLDILKYRNNVLIPIIADYKPIRSFNETAKVLRNRFIDRLQVFLSKQNNYDFTLLSSSYWNKIKLETNIDKLPDYYLKLDSDKKKLQEVVANGYHIANTKAKIFLYNNLKKIEKQGGGLLKILSNGGEGKSTLIMDIGFELCSEYPVFLVKHWERDTVSKIEKQIVLLGTKKSPILLIDDVANQESGIEQYGSSIENSKTPFIIIIAERYYRYQQMSCMETFESYFNYEPIQLNLASSENAPEIFEKLFKLLKFKNSKLTNEDYINSGKLFITEGKHTIAERIFKILKLLKNQGKIHFEFDWDEWKKVHKNTPLENLYLLVASFYQFGNCITVDFCREFSDFKNLTSISIRDNVDSNHNQPIIRNGNYLHLRHEKIADWYIEDENQQENVKAIFKEWIRNIKSQFSKNILIGIYKNHDFRNCSYLKDLLSIEYTLKLLLKFISDNPTEISARAEVAKIYVNQKQFNEAVKLMCEMVSIKPDVPNTRIELSKIYQQQRKWEEAEMILKEGIRLSPNASLYFRTHLSRIYRQQEKWDDAQKILLECYNIDKTHLPPRTELSKIYQQMGKWKDAEDILLGSLEIDKSHLHSHTELSKVYKQQRKWRKAEGILKKALTIEPDNFIILTEKALLYKKWSKNIFARKNKLKYKHNYIKTVIKSYESKTDNIPILMELVYIFKKQKQFRAALLFLDMILKINEADLECIRIQMQICKLMDNLNMFQNCRFKGEEIILKNNYVKFRNRFEKENQNSKMLYNKDKIIVEMKMKGRYSFIKENNECFIEELNGNQLTLIENAQINKRIKINDDVLYAIYHCDGAIKADFIEPFFTNEVDLIDSLKH